MTVEGEQTMLAVPMQDLLEHSGIEGEAYGSQRDTAAGVVP